MIKIIKKLLKKIPIVHSLVDRRKYKKKLDVRTLPLEKRIELMLNKYQARLGYRMDINHPVTYTEKMQWYKLYYRDPLMKRCVDKYEVRDYVKECGYDTLAALYQNYREQRTKLREHKSDLMKKIIAIGVETDRDNANVGNNFSAKLLRIASEANK